MNHQIAVRIANPGDGAKFTGIARAERYTANGAATWVIPGEVIALTLKAKERKYAGSQPLGHSPHHAHKYERISVYGKRRALTGGLTRTEHQPAPPLKRNWP